SYRFVILPDGAAAYAVEAGSRAANGSMATPFSIQEQWRQFRLLPTCPSTGSATATTIKSQALSNQGLPLFMPACVLPFAELDQRESSSGHPRFVQNSTPGGRPARRALSLGRFHRWLEEFPCWFVDELSRLIGLVDVDIPRNRKSIDQPPVWLIW